MNQVEAIRQRRAASRAERAHNEKDRRSIAKKRNKDNELDVFLSLRNEEIKNTVYNELSSGKDPVLKGKKYMREYVKDSEMRTMIDKAYKQEKEIMQNDEFITLSLIHI